ncbi:hypothetical protein C8Q74DRAFT_410369 [Fomes fomentarius]|nr:hypothetical protein C8Q74DRAFT_410369 [Fomes fomentarius]
MIPKPDSKAVVLILNSYLASAHGGADVHRYIHCPAGRDSRWLPWSSVIHHCHRARSNKGSGAAARHGRAERRLGACSEKVEGRENLRRRDHKGGGSEAGGASVHPFSLSVVSSRATACACAVTRLSVDVITASMEAGRARAPPTTVESRPRRECVCACVCAERAGGGKWIARAPSRGSRRSECRARESLSWMRCAARSIGKVFFVIGLGPGFPTRAIRRERVQASIRRLGCGSEVGRGSKGLGGRQTRTGVGDGDGDDGRRRAL